ncbi:MAG: hypothetical protein AAB425_05665, partial [Bdellovibrionota bacterium]
MRRLFGLIALSLLVFDTSCVSVRRTPSGFPEDAFRFVRDPIVATAQLIKRDIFGMADQVTTEIERVVMPLALRPVLTTYLTTLPLERDAKARLITRINSGPWMHQLVPFLLFLKRLYLNVGSAAGEDFDQYLRREFASARATP